MVVNIRFNVILSATWINIIKIRYTRYRVVHQSICIRHTSLINCFTLNLSRILFISSIYISLYQQVIEKLFIEEKTLSYLYIPRVTQHIYVVHVQKCVTYVFARCRESGVAQRLQKILRLQISAISCLFLLKMIPRRQPTFFSVFAITLRENSRFHHLRLICNWSNINREPIIDQILTPNWSIPLNTQRHWSIPME